MLVRDLGLIFVHVPKTGGQSIESAVFEHLGESWSTRHKFLMGQNDDPAVGPPRLAHLTASEYRDLGHVSETEFADLFKFGFVRNPWDRLLSEYRFRRALRKIPFKTWVLEQFPREGWDDKWRHVMPQSDFLYDKNGQPAVDFIGRFETLGQDYQRMMDMLGVKLPELRRVNSTTNLPFAKRLRKFGLLPGLRGVADETMRAVLGRAPKRWQDHYDAETRAFVARFYAEDIERFGYRFDD